MKIFTLVGIVPDYYQAGYVLVKDGQALAIDAAFDPEALLALLTEQNATLHAFLLTHCHFDHVINADVLPARFDAPLYASPSRKGCLTTVAGWDKWTGIIM